MRNNPRQDQINRLRQQQRGSDFFDSWEDNFDKNFKRIGAGFVAFWIAFVLVDLALLGVVIWAIIKLVNHFA